MYLYTKILFSLTIVLYLFLQISYQCSNSGYPFENYLATKTPYRIVSNKSFDKMEFPGCTPKKIWMIVRHGTRLPSAKNIKYYSERLPYIRKLILDSRVLPNEFIKNRDLDLFTKWKFTVEEEDRKKLTTEGEEEMLLLAERMQSRFPDLFNPIYSNTTYKFKSTRTQRTKKSATSFVSGLFGRQASRDVWFPEPLAKDPILRFYKLCARWRTEIKKNVETYKERDQFLKGPEMQAVVNNINKRIGFNELTNIDVASMYSLCGFETSWNKYRKSPWCSVFSVDDLKVLAYLEDLKYYWQDGYGHQLSYKQACPAFGDMMNFFESPDPFPKATVYFTHSGTLLKMLGHLGLYRDEHHLKADSYNKLKDTRKWKTSQIDSFGSNLAFILFDCGTAGEKILTMHQERIVHLPCCPTEDLCDKITIDRYYVDSVNKCDFKEMCGIDKEANQEVVRKMVELDIDL